VTTPTRTHQSQAAAQGHGLGDSASSVLSATRKLISLLPKVKPSHIDRRSGASQGFVRYIGVENIFF
jgi:hypothetical protein